MRQLFTMITIILMTMSSFAQENNIPLDISVAMHSECELDNNSKTLRKNKLLNLANSNNLTVVDYGAVAMIPSVTVLKETVIEGSMKNILSIELQVTIKVLSVFDGTIFNTMYIECKGEGYSKTEAQHSAIKKMDLMACDEGLRLAISKIGVYYKSKTSAIIAKASTLASQQKYDEAFAILSSYPESFPGYQQISATIVDIFKTAQTQYCSQILQEARSYYANRDFETAAYLLAMIDANSNCKQDVEKLQSAIKHDVDGVYTNEINEEKERRKSNERIAKATINTAKDIAVAYYQRHPEYIFFW